MADDLRAVRRQGISTASNALEAAVKAAHLVCFQRAKLTQAREISFRAYRIRAFLSSKLVSVCRGTDSTMTPLGDASRWRGSAQIRLDSSKSTLGDCAPPQPSSPNQAAWSPGGFLLRKNPVPNPPAPRPRSLTPPFTTISVTPDRPLQSALWRVDQDPADRHRRQPDRD